MLTLVWGEPDDTGKTSAERHDQAEIRVKVAPTPYASQARESYADGAGGPRRPERRDARRSRPGRWARPRQ